MIYFNDTNSKNYSSLVWLWVLLLLCADKMTEPIVRKLNNHKRLTLPY